MTIGLPGFLLRHPHARAFLHVPDPPFARPEMLESVTLPGFVLRPYRLCDEQDWQRARQDSRDWLAPWDSTDPMDKPAMDFAHWVADLDWQALTGSALVLTMRKDGRFVGEISLGALEFGSLRSGIVGYWVCRDAAGHGFAPLALAVLADWAFFDPTGPRLNRVEVDLLPGNARSRRVAQKNGMSLRGIRPAWMHVAGHWEDHEVWDLLAADVLGSARRTYRPDGPQARAAAREHPCERRLEALRQP